MTPSQTNLAIAELCGWRMVDVFEWDGDIRRPKQFHRSGALLHDYLNDWNTRQEMLSVIVKMCYWSTFGENLIKAVGHLLPSMTRGYDIWLGASCTQAQFCQAFLETMGVKT